jgi:hypothetical protein
MDLGCLLVLFSWGFVMQKHWLIGCVLAAVLIACGKKEEPVAMVPAAPAAAPAPAEGAAAPAAETKA